MKILLIPDVPGWAWDHKADALIKYLPEHDINKVYVKNFHPDMIKDYDSVHSFSWKVNSDLARKVTGGLSSFHFSLKHKKKFDKIAPKLLGLTTASTQLHNTIQTLYPKIPLYNCPNGVDTSVFYPRRKKHDNLVVGWVGNPTEGGFNRNNGKMDIKGYGHILEPLIKDFSRINGIKFKIHACKWNKAIPHEEMADFYQDVDIMLCTSIMEGTPNPMFEAAACGCALLSTKVGAIQELISEKFVDSNFVEDSIIYRNGYMCHPYDDIGSAAAVRDWFKKMILKLNENREICKIMGEISANKAAKRWSWKLRAKQWLPVFEKGRLR